MGFFGYVYACSPLQRLMRRILIFRPNSIRMCSRVYQEKERLRRTILALAPRSSVPRRDDAHRLGCFSVRVPRFCYSVLSRSELLVQFVSFSSHDT